jgi:hypothetical protein
MEIFDSLPDPDPTKLAIIVRRNLERALPPLKKFIASVDKGYVPAWPTDAELYLLVAQVRWYRSISRRRPQATAMQIIREIDHRWTNLEIERTVDRLVRALDGYLGESTIARAIRAQGLTDLGDKRTIAVISKNLTAEPIDLSWMLEILPPYFGKMAGLLDAHVVPSRTGQRDAVSLLKRFLVQAAQDFLYAEHTAFMTRVRAAYRLRTFIFDLGDPDYQRRLFGLSKHELELWEKQYRRNLIRRRVARHRAAKRKSRVT